MLSALYVLPDAILAQLRELNAIPAETDSERIMGFLAKAACF